MGILISVLLGVVGLAAGWGNFVDRTSDGPLIRRVRAWGWALAAALVALTVAASMLAQHRDRQLRDLAEQRDRQLSDLSFQTSTMEQGFRASQEAAMDKIDTLTEANAGLQSRLDVANARLALLGKGQLDTRRQLGSGFDAASSQRRIEALERELAQNGYVVIGLSDTAAENWALRKGLKAGPQTIDEPSGVIWAHEGHRLLKPGSR